jgi:hypothetical protein
MDVALYRQTADIFRYSAFDESIFKKPYSSQRA